MAIETVSLDPEVADDRARHAQASQTHRALFATIGLLVLGCHRNSNVAEPGKQSAKEAQVVTVEVPPAPSTGLGSPSSALGNRSSRPVAASDDCSSPTEAGCNPCCIEEADGRCTTKSWQTGGLTAEDLGGIEPWYNASGIARGTCPADCRRCAACSKRQKEELQSLRVRPECDCTQDPGIDACFAPESCDCYCERRTHLVSVCGEPR